MKYLASMVSLALVSVASANAAVLSGPAYNPATTHTYYLLPSSSWTAAESAAVSLGGHLVTVNDAAENAWLLATFSNLGGQPRALWTGLNDRAHEGTFTWSSGESAPYRQWEPGQPDNGGGFYPSEEYVLIWPSPGPRSPGLWNDYVDSGTFPDMSLQVFGVVEVPEPSAFAFLLVALGAASARRHQLAKHASPTPASFPSPAFGKPR